LGYIISHGVIRMTHTDYSDGFNWIARGGTLDKPVDVFHITPTSWYGQTDGELFSDIADPVYREMAEMNTRLQASVFEKCANLFVPHYRQLEPRFCLSLSYEGRLRYIEQEPKRDIFDALDYYFEHFNCGRPFILSGHSQGSIVMLTVLSEYMKNHPDRYRRMIAAYLIGYSVTDRFLSDNPHLRFAEGADDTGVIISYNTQAPEFEGVNPLVFEGAQVINPISWSRGEEHIAARESLGSRIKGRDSGSCADARVDKRRGCLICSTADANRLKSEIFEKGVYHNHDYGLYYYDLRRNAAVRIESFVKTSEKSSNNIKKP